MSNLINPSEMYEETDDSSHAKIRLMVCPVCRTIDPLPAFDGPDEYDETGQARATLHMFDDNRFHPFIVGTVSEESWNNPRLRPHIVDKVSQEINPVPAGDGDGLGQEAYDVKNTFAEDAMRCWRIEHNRTKDCGDWKIDRKRLIPYTQAERKAEGLPHRARDIRSNTYLCDYCVMRSVKQSKIVKEKY
jgi:hypothetical protein